MIPVLFKEDEQVFSHNGIGALYESLSCDIYEAENGSFTMELEYPVDGEWFSELKDFRIVQAKPNDIDEPHNFRIYEIEKSIDELSVYVRANTRTNDLGSNLITNYVDRDVTPQQAMNGMKNNLIEPTDFDLISDIQTRSNVEWTRLNPLNAIVGVRGSMVDIWGGEIKRTNNAIYLYSRRGQDNVTTIRPGKNIEGLDMTVSTAGLITKILPSYSYRPVEVPEYQMVEMYDGTRQKRRVTNSGDTTLKDDLTVLGDVVTSQYVDNYPIHYWASVDYNSDEELSETIDNYVDNRLREADESETILDMSNFNKDLEEFVKTELDKRAERYFTHRNPGVDKPTVRINVDMLQLSDSPEWDLFESLERIGLTDTLDVWVDKYDIDVEVRVTGLYYDSIGERVTGFNAGSDRAPRQSAIEKKYDDLTQATNDYITSFKNGVQNIMRNTADGLNRKFEGYTEPPAELSSEGDIWFKQLGEGKVEIWIHDGVYWQPLMTEDFGKKIEADILEQQKDIDAAKEAADEAVNDINDAVESAGFTSLSETIGHIDTIANNAESNSQQAITDASNAFSAAQSALSGLDDKVDTSIYNTTLLDLEADIDSAITAGNTAKETAEGLVTEVEAIGTVANSAKQEAEDAVSTANTAKETAEGLITQVEDVGTIADSARQDAETAVSTANAAKTSADSLSTEVSGLKTDVEGFELTVNDYQNQVSQFSADVDGFQSTVASYTTEVDEFGNIVSTNTTQVNELKNDINGFESLLASYDEDLTGFNTTVSSFRNTLEGLESTVASYETEVDEYGNEVATYATELSTLRNTVNGFESTVSEFDITVTGYQTSLATLTNTVEGFESTVANYETQVDEYGNAVSSYATEVATLENTVDGFNSLVASFELEAEGYSAEVSEFRNTVSGLQSTVASYEVELDEFGNAVDAYATEVSTLENTVSGFESSVTTYGQEVNSLTDEVSTYATQVSNFSNTVDGLNNTVANYETEVDEFGNTVSTYATEVSTMQNTVSGFESAVATYGTEVSDLAGEVVGYKNQVSTLNNTVSGFNSTVASYTTEVNEFGLEVESYATEVSTLTNTVSGFQSTVSRVEQDYEYVSGTVATHTSEISNLDGEIALKANTSTVNTLTGRVTTAETGITSNADAIKLKANTTTVNSLTGRVTTAETGITANANDIKLKANTTTVNELTGRMNSAETSISANATSIGLKASQSSVDTLTGTVSTLSGKIDVTAGQISSKVWNTDIQTAVDGIEVGGRNYFSLTHLNNISPSSWVVRAYVYNFTLEPNTKYILSSNVPTNGSTSENVLYFNGSGTSASGAWLNNPRIVETDSEGKFYIAIPTGRPYTVDILNGNYWVQLERGNKATDWTPAPEDTTALINHVESELTQKHDTITASVSSIDGRVATNKLSLDGLTTTVQSVESDLSGTTTLLSTTRTTVSGHTSSISALRTDVDGKATTAQFNTLNSTVNGTIQRVGNSEGKITTLETSVSGLQTTVAGKAAQSQVTQLSNSLSSTIKDVDSNTTQISQNATNINLRVKEGDVVTQLNIDANRTLISSSKILLNANTVSISGTSWMSGAVITNASIKTAKIEDLAVTSAKIANIDASKISTGTIRSVILENSGIATFTDLSTNGRTTIHGGNIRANSLNVSALDGIGGGVALDGQGILVATGITNRNDYLRLIGGSLRFFTEGTTLAGSIETSTSPVGVSLYVEDNYEFNVIRRLYGNPSENILRARWNGVDVYKPLRAHDTLSMLGNSISDIAEIRWMYGNPRVYAQSSGNLVFDTSAEYDIRRDGSTLMKVVSAGLQMHGVINMNSNVINNPSAINMGGSNINTIGRLGFSGTGTTNITTTASRFNIYSTKDIYIARGSVSAIRVLSGGVQMGTLLNMNSYTIINSPSISDASLKDVHGLRTHNDLDKLMDIEYVDFRWKDEQYGGQDLGFVAQQVQNVVPEIIMETSDGTLGYNNQTYLNFIGHSVQQLGLREQNTNQVASQALQATETNEEKIERLEKRIEELESAI